MTFDPHKASTDELRDWLAEQDGWQFDPEPAGGWWRYRLNSLYGGRTWADPHPHRRTLDGAAAALPVATRAEHRHCEVMSRWEWSVLEQTPSGGWSRLVSGVCDTGDEIHDRYLLAVLARLAHKVKPATCPATIALTRECKDAADTPEPGSDGGG